MAERGDRSLTGSANCVVLLRMSQDRLCADTSGDQAYLSGLERQTESPTVDLLDRVSVTLPVPLWEPFVAPELKVSRAVRLQNLHRR